MLPFELLIGLRYTHAKRRNHFISFISIVSMAGIALGVMALIVVLSVMNGFQEELRTRILGVAAHLEISGPGERLPDWRSVMAQARQHKDVMSGAPYVNAQGMLANGDMVRGAIIRGVLPEMENRVADFAQHMKAGQLADLNAEILALARHHEEREKADHPLERILRIDEPGGAIEIRTTTARLARGIGEAIHHAYSGDLVCPTQEAEGVLRVAWER